MVRWGCSWGIRLGGVACSVYHEAAPSLRLPANGLGGVERRLPPRSPCCPCSDNIFHKLATRLRFSLSAWPNAAPPPLVYAGASLGCRPTCVVASGLCRGEGNSAREEYSTTQRAPPTRREEAASEGVGGAKDGNTQTNAAACPPACPLPHHVLHVRLSTGLFCPLAPAVLSGRVEATNIGRALQTSL